MKWNVLLTKFFSLISFSSQCHSEHACLHPWIYFTSQSFRNGVLITSVIGNHDQTEQIARASRREIQVSTNEVADLSYDTQNGTLHTNEVPDFWKIHKMPLKLRESKKMSKVFRCYPTSLYAIHVKIVLLLI